MTHKRQIELEGQAVQFLRMVLRSAAPSDLKILAGILDEYAEVRILQSPYLVLRRLSGTSIEELELSVRSSNCLKRAGIETVGQLVKQNARELKRLPNFGVRSLWEVQEVLQNIGLHLGMEDPTC